METRTGGDGGSGAPSDELPVATRRKNRRFFQFTLRQILLLFAVVSVLLCILTPRIRWAFHVRRIQEAGRRREVAEADLSIAIRTNNVALARRALEAGAEPNPPILLSQPRLSWLCSCIANGQIEMVELLLDFGADIERIDQVPNSIPGPVRSGPPLFAAVGCSQPAEVRTKMVRLLVARGANPRSQFAGHSAMDIAFEAADAQMGDLLREYGLPYGPREMAAFDRLDELKVAVQETPELLQRRFRDAYAGRGPTLLGIALRRSYCELALFLIESGAPLDVREHEGYTLLHEAAIGGDPQLIRLLVERGLDVNATDDYSDTPLRDIAARDKPEAVAALLELGANVDQQGINGDSPLHSAVRSDRLETVRLLLAAGAAPTLPNSKGETPLDLARTRKPEIAKQLEQATDAERTTAQN